MNSQLSEVRCEPATSCSLPRAVVVFLQAVNNSDVVLMLEQFAESAVVNDQFEEFEGKCSIEDWSRRDVIGMNMNISVSDVRQRPTGVILTAEVKGSFEGYGLPEPLVLLFYVTLHNEQIDQLIILRKAL